MTLDTYINTVHHMDALALMRSLPDASVQTIITSPPYYGLRSYINDESPDKPMEIGLEPTPAAFVGKMVDLFREARRVLRDDGTLWLNLGDSYVGSPRGNTDVANFTKSRKEGGLGWTADHARRGLTDYKFDKAKAVDLPEKSLLGIPWRVAFGLQDDGWILRSDIIWAKPNPMPESVTDRPTKAHEYVFLFSKQTRYYYDADAIAEPAQDWGERDRANGKYHNEGTGLTPHTGLTGKPKLTGGNFSKRYADAQPAHGGDSVRRPYLTRNKRTVWTVPTQPNSEAHFATFPPKLITPMILAGAPVGGVVLDPFMGSGTTALVARQLGRQFIGCDLNPEYVAMANRRLSQPHTPDMFYTLAAAE